LQAQLESQDAIIDVFINDAHEKREKLLKFKAEVEGIEKSNDIIRQNKFSKRSTNELVPSQPSEPEEKDIFKELTISIQQLQQKIDGLISKIEIPISLNMSNNSDREIPSESLFCRETKAHVSDYLDYFPQESFSTFAPLKARNQRSRLNNIFQRDTHKMKEIPIIKEQHSKSDKT
jgi:hypothetical protein